MLIYSYTMVVQYLTIFYKPTMIPGGTILSDIEREFFCEQFEGTSMTVVSVWSKKNTVYGNNCSAKYKDYLHKRLLRHVLSYLYFYCETRIEKKLNQNARALPRYTVLSDNEDNFVC